MLAIVVSEIPYRFEQLPRWQDLANSTFDFHGRRSLTGGLYLRYASFISLPPAAHLAFYIHGLSAQCHILDHPPISKFKACLLDNRLLCHLRGKSRIVVREPKSGLFACALSGFFLSHPDNFFGLMMRLCSAVRGRCSDCGAANASS